MAHLRQGVADGDAGGQSFSASGTNAAFEKLKLLQPAIPTVAHRVTESNGTFIPDIVCVENQVR